MEGLWGDIKGFFVTITADAVLKIAGAAIFLLIGIKIIRVLTSLLNKSMEKSRLDRGLLGFLSNALSFALRFTLIISLLIYLGVPSASFIAIFSSIGLAVGLALQGSLSNFAGGLMLLFFHPFRVGDYIVTQSGFEGTVRDVSMMYTTLETLERKKVVIPNAGLSNGVITNVSAYPTRRISISVTTEFSADSNLVRSLMEAAASSNSKVLAEPAPTAFLEKFQDGLLLFTLRCYADTKDWWDTQLQVTEQVKAQLLSQGIAVRAPIREFRQIK